MTMDITQILLSAQTPDAQIRTHAEANLKQFHDENLPHFLLMLSLELANEQKPPESRRLAGIILKNSLDAKDSSRKNELTQQWVGVDASIKFQIRNSLVMTLASHVSEARHTSSQVIAKVASIEIPRKEWQDLIEHLLNNMTQPDSSNFVKQATVEALGYICEEICPEDLEQAQVNAVLTAVVQGMNHAEQDPEIRLAATKALYNALDFAQTNFDNEMERNYIMKVVCETAVSKEMEIKQAAFECLVSIASMYYEYLEPYMEAIFILTQNAIKGDEEPVALQAIEFWSSICDEEIAIQEQSELDGDGCSSFHSNFIKKALPSLAPLLLETLLKQEEEQDQDDNIWNLSMAGGTCLGLIARTVGDDIVPLVMPFVEGNITKSDWRCREAATFAFGSILEGPSKEKLIPLVHAGLDFLLNAMKDQSSHVKDTTAWTLGKIFEILHSTDSDYSVLNAANLPRIMSVLLESIRDAPNVAERVCGAIYFLAHGYQDGGSNSLVLTSYLGDVMSALLETADRADASNSKLRSSAYETLNEIIRCSNLSETTANMIAHLLQEIMSRLAKTMEIQILSSDDREKQSDLQALLCGVLQVIIQKMSAVEETKLIVFQSVDDIICLLLKVFSCRSSTVHEEAMRVIGALAYAKGHQFATYMPRLYQYLEMGLQNFEEYEVCAISVGVVGDICRSVEEEILPYCDGIMSQLLKDLSNSMLNRSVKPPIFSCFGDIALAIGQHFEKYVPYVMPMLQGAAELCYQFDSTDADTVDYANQLRRGIFEAYSGILQGFKSSKAELMVPHASNLLQFIESVVRDKNRDEEVTKATVAVMGDLADTLGPNTKVLFHGCTVHSDLLIECFQSDDDQLKETAKWTQEMIQHVLVS